MANKFTPTQYAQALLDAISETAPKDHDKVLDNFVRVLAQNGDLGKHDEIQQQFRKLKLASEGIKEAEVVVGKPHEISHEIIHELNKIIGGKTEVKTRVDESLIGGVVVRIDDTLIDASVKKQLDSLNNSLRS